jgi:8-oxo-dGTP diphosphatase
MAMSPYLQALRATVGPRLLVLPSVAGIVFDGDRRILLVRQRDVGIWSTPGGSMEPNETPANAVVREVWEETGLQTAPTKILGVFGGPHCAVTYPNGHQTTYVTTVFECQVRGGTLLQSTAETFAAAYFGPQDLNELAMTPWAAFLLPRLFAGRSEADFEPESWLPPLD